MPPPAHPEAPHLTGSRALRQATADVHAALEARLPLRRATFTRADYVATLARLLAVYAPLEAAVDRHAPALAALGLAWPPRRKVPALRRDLAALAAEPRAPPAATVAAAATGVCPAAPAAPLPVLASVDAALGCLYVVEGATLGGRLLAAHFAAHLGVSAAHGAAYFSSYGAARGRMWRALCAVLDAALQDPAPRARAIAAARETFTLLGRALAGPGH